LSYAIWERIQSWFDGKIKEMGVQNAYFPLFVTEAALTKEKDHVEGFAAEASLRALLRPNESGHGSFVSRHGRPC
jgi:prolyl-tRNA synthetase